MRAPVRPINSTNVETITGCDGGDAVVYGHRGESAAMPMGGELEREGDDRGDDLDEAD